MGTIWLYLGRRNVYNFSNLEAQRNSGADITISLYQLENSMVHYMFHD